MSESVEPANGARSVEDVLHYYHTEVVKAVAISYAVANQFPLEILNEIRASMTHLAKASALGKEHADFQSEVSAAWRHLKRTCLDCFKLSIFGIAKRADEQIGQLLKIHALPNDVLAESSELRA